MPDMPIIRARPTPRSWRTQRTDWGNLLLLFSPILALLAVLAAMLLIGLVPNLNSVVATRTLWARVEVPIAGTISITNTGAEAWTSVLITINEDFTERIDEIAAGGTVSGGLGTFSDAEGLRFNPLEREVISIEITAELPDGSRGSWSEP